jgi:tetratricopeptide (TPR) repeat protein
MKCLHKALLLSTVVIFCGASFGAATAVLQDAKPAAEAQGEDQGSPPEYVAAYNCYDGATKEADVLKKGTMLMECIKNHAQSTLMPNFESAYKKSMFDSYNDKKYQELETLAEQWLALHPNNLEATVYLVDVADKLNRDEKFIQRATELYQMKPMSDLAVKIAQAYERLKNTEKCVEWIEKAIKFPENEANFTLRFYLVQTYSKLNNTAKILEWAQATLKAALLVKEPSEDTRKELAEKRYACYNVIGGNMFQDKKYPEAIKAFKEALKIKPYAEGYYYIGVCLQNQKKADAMLWYAKTENWCEKFTKESKECKDIVPKAKAEKEKIYASLHDGFTETAWKVNRDANEQPESYWTSDEN